MHVYCAPNLGRESFGMVLTEAMAAGTPVLASDLDAFRMVLGPDGGVLVPRADPVALADALAALLDDPDRREELAMIGRHRAARYDWPVVAGEVIQVYQAAIAADPRRLAAGGPPPPMGPRRSPRSTARRVHR
jgi:phosphatidylinositol alpha-mannosyltransferase